MNEENKYQRAEIIKAVTEKASNYDWITLESKLKNYLTFLLNIFDLRNFISTFYLALLPSEIY